MATHDFEWVGLTEYTIDPDDGLQDSIIYQIESVKALWRCEDDGCPSWGVVRLHEDKQVPGGTVDHNHDEYEYEDVGIVENHNSLSDYGVVQVCTKDGCDAWRVTSGSLDLDDRVFPTDHAIPGGTYDHAKEPTDE